MLGFTLSKVNMLIFVTAIFAIVTFFTVTLCQVTTVNELNLILDRLTRRGYALANSPAYCDSTFYHFPAEISSCGQRFFYSVNISVQQATDAGGDPINYLIFSAFNRRDTQQDNALVADSLRTNADITLFNFQPLSVAGNEGIAIDPQARIPVNGVALVKEIVGGQTQVYVVPCNSEANQCEVRKEEAGCLIKTGDTSCAGGTRTGFNC